VTAAQPDTIPGKHIAPFAAGVVLPIAALTAVLHCFASIFGGGYWFDEVYMLAIGRYLLDWGSADQPPLAPALTALTDAVAPGSLIALRGTRCAGDRRRSCCCRSHRPRTGM
jgi:hypothetical protein